MSVYYGRDIYTPTDFITHHGIKGQKWGVRRYQNEDGSYTQQGKARYSGTTTTKKLNTVTPQKNTKSINKQLTTNTTVIKAGVELSKQRKQFEKEWEERNVTGGSSSVSSTKEEELSNKMISKELDDAIEDLKNYKQKIANMNSDQLKKEMDNWENVVFNAMNTPTPSNKTDAKKLQILKETAQAKAQAARVAYNDRKEKEEIAKKALADALVRTKTSTVGSVGKTVNRAAGVVKKNRK